MMEIDTSIWRRGFGRRPVKVGQILRLAETDSFYDAPAWFVFNCPPNMLDREHDGRLFILEGDTDKYYCDDVQNLLVTSIRYLRRPDGDWPIIGILDTDGTPLEIAPIVGDLQMRFVRVRSSGSQEPTP
jgi:hypothetical protein